MEGIQHRLTESNAAQAETLGNAATALANSAQAVTASFEERMEAIQRRLAEFNAAQAESVGNVATALTSGAQAVNASIESWHQAAERIAGDHQRLLEATTRLQEVLHDNTQRLGELIEKCPDHWQALTSSLDQLREVTTQSYGRLGQLITDGRAEHGEVQPRSQKGWFGLWKRS